MENTNKKYVFLDIDGTLIDTGEVLHESTAKALRLAMENGHKLFICTGREKHFVSKILFDAGLSDGVFSAGANVFCGGKNIFHSSFPAELYNRMVKVLVKHKAVVTLETIKEEIFLDQTIKKGYEGFTAWLNVLGAVFSKDIPQDLDNVDKIVFVGSESPVSLIQNEIGSDCNIVTMSYQSGDNGGEIMQKDITKATGIQKVLDFYGADVKDAVGIGDGANDIEMLQFCGTGIAMGNADERAKAAADIITDDIDKDGLYNAFKRMGLI